MASSGTTDFTLPIDELIEQAAERVGADPLVGKELRTARRALDILFTDLQNRGVLLHTLMLAETSVDISAQTVSLPADTVDVLQIMWRTSGIDVPVERQSFGEYMNITKKLQNAVRPTQIYIQRNVDETVAYLWPIPDNEGALVYWRVRRIQDGGSMQNTADMTRRFWPALVSGLAYYMGLNRGLKFPLDRLNLLKQEYEQELLRAMEEDRERVVCRLRPKYERKR